MLHLSRVFENDEGFQQAGEMEVIIFFKCKCEILRRDIEDIGKIAMVTIGA